MIILCIATFFVIDYVSKNNAIDENDYLYEIAVDDLLTEYKDNAIQASLKYEDKVVKITGTIDSIDGDKDQVQIVLEDSVLMYRVVLIFTDSDEIEQISSLVSGDDIVVVGKVNALENTVITNILSISKCNYID